MPATRTRRPVPAVAGQFELMLGRPPAADGQLDLVAACHDAMAHHPAAPPAARHLADSLSASGVRCRALADGGITNAPYPATRTERVAAEVARCAVAGPLEYAARGPRALAILAARGDDEAIAELARRAG